MDTPTLGDGQQPFAALAFDVPPCDGTVLLRHWTPADAEAIAQACSDPAIQRWTHVPANYAIADARAFVEAAERERAERRSFQIAVAPAEDPTAVLGSVGLVGIDWPDGIGEIGYWVCPGARGQGVATRAAMLLSTWTFQTLPLSRIVLMADARNAPSMQVAGRAGFLCEATAPCAKDLLGEVVRYSLSRGAVSR
jgi:RimJ/RimL family protein N-acetyltransferase